MYQMSIYDVLENRMPPKTKAAAASCRYITEAIDAHVNAWPTAGVRVTRSIEQSRAKLRERLLAGVASDVEAEAIIFHAATLRDEEARRKHKRRVRLKWAGETIE